MAFISTEAINGFAEMTDAQKVEALLKFEIPEAVDLSKYVEKSVFDKKASETAALSKQLKERMTEDEQKKAEEAETLQKMQTELETLRKDKTIADYTAQYIGMGYDKELAADTAKAMAEGDMAKVFANGAKHKEVMEKKIKEDLMNRTPKPGGNGSSGGDDGKDLAVEKAKELAKAKYGSDKQYANVMDNYVK